MCVCVEGGHVHECVYEARRGQSQNAVLLEATRAAPGGSTSADHRSHRGGDDVVSSALSPTLPAERRPLPVPAQGRGAPARASVGRLHPRRSVEGPWSENSGFPCTTPRLVPGHAPGHATRWPTSGVSGNRSLNEQEVRVQERQQLPRMSLELYDKHMRSLVPWNKLPQNLVA